MMMHDRKLIFVLMLSILFKGYGQFSGGSNDTLLSLREVSELVVNSMNQVYFDFSLLTEEVPRNSLALCFQPEKDEHVYLSYTFREKKLRSCAELGVSLDRSSIFILKLCRPIFHRKNK